MPKISKRGTLMPNSPIRKLVPLAEEAERKGKNIIRLNIGQPDIPTSDKALAAIRNLNVQVIEYSHSAGMESLRRKMAEYYSRHKIDVSYEDILITTGGSEAITLTLLTCLNADDEILVPEPFYANYYSFATSTDVKVVAISSHIEDGFRLPPIEDFEKKITDKTRGIIICNPNNPTGHVYSRQELEQIRDLVLKYDLFLLSDEVYREFVYDDEEFISIMNLEGLENNAILIDSLSKRYSATGLRTGALVTKNKQLRDTALKFCQARLSPPYVGQVAGEAALDSSDQYMDYVFNEYLTRRNFVVETLNKIPGVYCPKPKGAFYVMAKLPVDDAEKFAMWMLEEFDYNGSSVMVAPGAGFYTESNLGKQEIRIAYVINLEKLALGLKCLEKALEAYPYSIKNIKENQKAFLK
ncbi:MAG: pyridoxal phosphate-dependent aminotransferase [Bacteroidales bacterium]|nr:pyridoxal phosphate-dependent aminotransferase [Bacteroidales bacterium]MBN2817469.1 pyridoxal phosphate-dependent aminotransferase [Bacteroidales bacterium]